MRHIDPVAHAEDNLLHVDRAFAVAVEECKHEMGLSGLLYTEDLAICLEVDSRALLAVVGEVNVPLVGEPDFSISDAVFLRGPFSDESRNTKEKYVPRQTERASPASSRVS